MKASEFKALIKEEVKKADEVDAIMARYEADEKKAAFLKSPEYKR